LCCCAVVLLCCCAVVHSGGKHNRRNHDSPSHRPRNHTLYDIPHIRFVFQAIQKDLRSSLMMAGYCRNMQKAVYRIKEWYNQCILLVISTTSNMHGTNIKLVVNEFLDHVSFIG
jgi:hypothetical protein